MQTNLKISPILFALALIECIFWAHIMRDTPSQEYIKREISNTQNLFAVLSEDSKKLNNIPELPNNREEQILKPFCFLDDIVQKIDQLLENLPTLAARCPLFLPLFVISIFYQVISSNFSQGNKNRSGSSWMIEDAVDYAFKCCLSPPKVVLLVSNKFGEFLFADRYFVFSGWDLESLILQNCLERVQKTAAWEKIKSVVC